MSNFDRAYAFTKKWEVGGAGDGGYTNDPVDPGGETKWGITARALADAIKKGIVKPTTVKDLTEEDAKIIYRVNYWDMCHCDGRPVAFAVAIFDSAVNCGVAKVAIWLTDAKDAETLLSHRRAHYESIVKKNPKLKKFSKGWNNRLEDLHKYIKKIV